MFGGCDFSWTIFASKFKISLKINREISESWQRVEVHDNNFVISGLEEFDFKWNGEAGGFLSDLEISIQNINEDHYKKIS